MPRNFVPVVLLALASPGSGQFLRTWSSGFSYSSTEAHSHTSSFTSSSSWSRGADGNMHHDVKETRSEDLKNSLGMQHVESKTLCADGLCQQTAMKAVQPVAPRMNMPSRMPTPIEMLMEHMFKPQARVHEAAPEPPSRPFMVQAPPQARVIVSLLPVPPLRRPSLRGYPVVVVDDAVPLPPSESAIETPSDNLFDVLLPVFAVYSLIAAVLTTTILLLRKCSKSAAREPHIRTLAEPLAPVEETPPVLPSNRAAAGQLAQEEDLFSLTEKYMLNVYARAEEKVEKRGIRQYLCSVYDRVTA